MAESPRLPTVPTEHRADSHVLALYGCFLGDDHEGVSHGDLAEAFGLSEDAIDLLVHGTRRRQRRCWHSQGLPGPRSHRSRPRTDCLGCWTIPAYPTGPIGMGEFVAAVRRHG